MLFLTRQPMLAILVAVICGITTIGQAEAQPASSPHWRLDYLPVPTRIPRPISEMLFARYCQMLRLSDAQLVYTQSVFDEHRNKCQELSLKWTPILVEAAKPLAALTDQNVEYAQLYAMLMQQRDAFDRALDSADEGFFEQILPILGPSQQPDFVRVKLHRQRDRSPVMYNEIKESTIDLSSLVEQLRLADDAFKEVDGVLAEYEAEITPLFVARDRQFLRMAELVESSARSRYHDDGSPLDSADPADVARRDSMRDRIAQLHGDRAKAQTRIVSVNRKYLPRVADRLSPDAARTLKDSYACIAWSYVYPDHVDPESIYSAIMKTESLSPDLKAAIGDLWRQYRQRYELLNESAKNTSEWIENQFALRQNGREYRAKRAEIESTILKRIELSQRFVNELAGLLPPETAAKHRESIDAFAVRTKSERESLQIQ